MVTNKQVCKNTFGHVIYHLLHVLACMGYLHSFKDGDKHVCDFFKPASAFTSLQQNCFLIWPNYFRVRARPSEHQILLCRFLPRSVSSPTRKLVLCESQELHPNELLLHSIFNWWLLPNWQVGWTSRYAWRNGGKYQIRCWCNSLSISVMSDANPSFFHCFKGLLQDNLSASAPSSWDRQPFDSQQQGS